MSEEYEKQNPSQKEKIDEKAEELRELNKEVWSQVGKGGIDKREAALTTKGGQGD